MWCIFLLVKALHDNQSHSCTSWKNDITLTSNVFYSIHVHLQINAWSKPWPCSLMHVKKNFHSFISSFSWTGNKYLDVCQIYIHKAIYKNSQITYKVLHLTIWLRCSNWMSWSTNTWMQSLQITICLQIQSNDPPLLPDTMQGNLNGNKYHKWYFIKFGKSRILKSH